MTKRKWSIVGISVVSAGLLLASLVSARPGHGRSGWGGPGSFPLRVLQHLDLTETQQASIDAIKEKQRGSLTGLKNDLRQTRREIVNRLLGEADVEAGDFTALQAKLNQLRAALFEESLTMALAIRAELTPAQRAEAATKIEEMRARWAEKRAKRHHGGCAERHHEECAERHKTKDKDG